MIVKQEEVLALFRGPGPCENCGKVCKRLEPHHWRCRGADGGARLDLPINLIALGSAFDCGCHQRAQNGIIPSEQILWIIARREGSTPRRIEARIWKILRTPKK